MGGNKTVKTVPCPYILSTVIRPLCLSTNSLHSINPSPVPFSPKVPVVRNTRSELKKIMVHQINHLLLRATHLFQPVWQ